MFVSNLLYSRNKKMHEYIYVVYLSSVQMLGCFILAYKTTELQIAKSHLSNE